MTRLLALLLALVAATAHAAPLDDVARDYLRLTLEIGEREPGYVDAYFGPPAIAAAAKARPRTLPELARAADALRARAAAAAATGSDDVRRRAFLVSQLDAARTRLRMLAGERLTFREEALGLFGVDVTPRPLADYDPVLARINALVPGPGPLWQRVDAFQSQFDIAPARLEPVMAAAIAECRRRTLPRISVPAPDRFTLGLVRDKPWSGYNWFQGGATSRIEINTDLPVRLPRAIDLGCHEGYPGHHTYHSLTEAKLARGRGWVEFTVVPLFSPMALVSEGSANYGIELAFPGNEGTRFEVGTLAPLAGLPTGEIARYAQLREALRALASARNTIAADYLDGRLTRARAEALTQTYQLVSPERARQSMDFVDKYRSYVVNYNLGLELVRAHVERAGPNAEQRWAAFARVLSEPTVPGDLAPPALSPRAAP